MIFAAGLGTRLKPITDTMPKALVKIAGKPLLAHVMEKLTKAGADRVIINVHHFASQIVNYLDTHSFGAETLISDESEMLLETGGGIRKAASLFRDSEPILIHNVDIISNVDISSFYKESADNDATLLVSERKTNRYLLFNDEMRLMGWTNISTGEVRSPYPNLNPADCKMYAFSGIHTFSPRLIPQMESFPDKFGIIDFYLKMCDKADIKGIVKDDLRLLDVGKLDSLDQAEHLIRDI